MSIYVSKTLLTKINACRDLLELYHSLDYTKITKHSKANTVNVFKDDCCVGESYKLLNGVQGLVNRRGKRICLYHPADPVNILSTQYFSVDNTCDLLATLRHINTFQTQQIPPVKNVAVVDLDDTLITGNCTLLPNATDLLDVLYRRYDHVILWSHGSNNHVYDNVSLINKQMGFNVFSRVIVKKFKDVETVKNPMYILNMLDIQFGTVDLFDDLIANATPDYDNVYIPNGCNLQNIINKLTIKND